MTPESPTAQAATAVVATAERRFVVKLIGACDVQLAPPSAVARIFPPGPTARASIDELGATPNSCSAVVACWFQVAPPSSVVRIVPPSPTAQSTEVDRAVIPRRVLAGAPVWARQVPPPSPLLRI